ncbi:MAG TPA: protein kinase [Polyangiaceae bacterium]|nr:protein kinase [Polyangiaceae bacterium]
MGEQARQIDALLESGEPRAFGRYVLYAPIARGGMATIHIARLLGDDGFSRIVAAKRLHPQFTEDPDFVELFRDEAEIASKVRHPNVVPVLDIVLDGEEVILVQEYVHGVPLDRLFRAASSRAEPIPPRIVAGIIAGVLSGLHAAHETCDDRSTPLGIVHRDVSPQNIMVSTDGIPRLLDFGIAKAQTSAHVTRAGLLMGKLAYMAPEQMRSEAVTRAADIYSSGVVLWELLALRRLHADKGQTQILSAVLNGPAPSLTQVLEPMREAISRDRWELISRIAPIATRAMAMEPADRYPSAAEMLRDLARVAPIASALEVADWVKSRGREYLERRQQVLARIEESWRSVSKISVATPPSGPVSGVQRVRAASGIVTAATLASDLVPASAMYIPVQPPETPPVSVPPAPLPASGAVRWVPWAVALVSLLVSTFLVAVLVSRRPAESPPMPPAREPVAVVTTPPADPASVGSPAPAESVVPTTSFLAPQMVAPRVVRAPAAPARKPTADVPLMPVHAAAAPAATGASAPRTDCDPPFYFEGTKKVFKPSCI